MRIRFLIILSLSIFISGCSKEDGIVIGYSPPGIPLILQASKNGVFLSYNNQLHTPIGTFSISIPLDSVVRNFNRHSTYVELINKKDNNKNIFVLNSVGESLTINSKYETEIKVINYVYYTHVIINSEEISNYIHVAPKADPKPRFPDSPIQYFILYKSIKLDWSVNNFWDLVQDMLYAILIVVIILLDLLIIAILFLLRLLWFLILVVIYFGASMFN